MEGLPKERDFEQLFKTYYPRLCHFSFQIVRDKVNAEDVVQETFIKYWRQREEIASHNIAIKNFLYSTVRNASLNVIRHDKIVCQHLEKQDPSPVEEFNIVHAIIRSEVFAEMHSALNTLPESCKCISKMGYIDGMKNNEIAQKLGISVNTVKTQKRRGLQLLRLILKPEVYIGLMMIMHY